MLKKIISAGENDAERAAVDVAINLDIPHKITEPDKNITESDGTLIITQGASSDETELIQKRIEKYHRPYLHIDLNITFPFNAVKEINEWIKNNHIKILNVTGWGKNIYHETLNILESVFYMGLIGTDIMDPLSATYQNKVRELIKRPKTVEQAVDMLISKLTFKEKTRIANMREEKLKSLQSSLGIYIRNEFRLISENDELMESCYDLSGKDEIDENEACALIIRELWKKLQNANVLRIVR